MKNLFKCSLIAFTLAFVSCDVDEEEANDTLVNVTSGCTDIKANNFEPLALEDDGSCEYDNDYLLSKAAWDFSSLTTTSEGGSEDSLFTARMEQLYFDFNEDKTFSGTIPGPGGVKSTIGTWLFESNETRLALTEDGNIMKYEINLLTTDSLGLGFTENNDSTTFEVNMILLHP